MAGNRLREVRDLYDELEHSPWFWALVLRVGFLLALVGVCWLMKG